MSLTPDDVDSFAIKMLISGFILGLLVSLFLHSVLPCSRSNQNCPEKTIAQTQNLDGTATCVLREDRDPAKVTKRVTK